MTLEKLAEKIMQECANDGEPVTKEEALEMARMEMGNKEILRYETAEETKKPRKPKERKIDEEKKYLLSCISTLIYGMNAASDITIKNEAEISFNYNNNAYTIKLIKHRKKS